MLQSRSFARRAGFLLASLALAAAPPSAAAGPLAAKAPAETTDWPQWRGPNRDAVSPAKGLLKAWPADGPEVLWRIPVGVGFSGISVSGKRLFTLWDEAGDQLLVAVDAATGDELWRRRIDAAFTSSWGDGPRATASVDGGVVYAVSARGRLHAVAAEDGRPIWSHDLAAAYGAGIPTYGYASSPLVEDDRLVVEVGGKEGFAFMAFAKTTGAVIWASQTEQSAYSSPLAITVGGVRQIVFFSASGLHAVAAADGRRLWHYGWDSSCPSTGIPTNVAQPVFIAPDRIFLSGGYGTVTGSAVVRIVADGETFRAEKIWQAPEPRNLMSSSVLHEGHIYGFDVGILQAVDARTGEVRWQARGFQRGSLIAADGHLIVLGEQGRLALAAAAPDGFRELASAQVLNGRSWTSPSLARGKLYLRNQSEMVSLDLTEPRD